MQRCWGHGGTHSLRAARHDGTTVSTDGERPLHHLQSRNVNVRTFIRSTCNKALSSCTRRMPLGIREEAGILHVTIWSRAKQGYMPRQQGLAEEPATMQLLPLLLRFPQLTACFCSFPIWFPLRPWSLSPICGALKPRRLYTLWLTSIEDENSKSDSDSDKVLVWFRAFSYS
jgi:hypothetical protein